MSALSGESGDQFNALDSYLLEPVPMVNFLFCGCCCCCCADII